MTPTKPMRRLPLSGAQNTRDLGGYPCAGGVTRWGTFLRSDHPSALTAADTAALSAYGITTAIDLRSNGERRHYPSLLEGCGGFACHHVPMSDDMHSVNFEGDLPGSMSGLYISLLDNAKEEIRRCFEIFADAPGGVLFHCAVGKDRTGVLSMLLLALAGVAEVDIVSDYAVTEIYMAEIFRNLPIPKGMEAPPDVVIRSLPDSMWRTLEHLNGVYGGGEKLLLACGVTPQQLKAVRDKFIDAASPLTVTG